MDLINWKKFCNNKDTKYLSLLSNEATQLVKSFLNKNCENKKLQNILKLYYENKIRKFKDTYTITFGDQAENNIGMQKIGKLSNEGFTCKELKKLYNEYNYKMEFINLSKYTEEKTDEACILIFRNFINADDLYDEQKKLNYDSKALMRGRVVNKLARHNLCFSNKSQEPDYCNGKGRIISYEDVPHLHKLLEKLPIIFGEKANDLVAEGNHYYDIKKNGIGFHGDGERKKVIAIRLGASMPFHFQWFQNSKPIGKRVELILNHGDMYIMSQKAVGFDWKKRKIPTLRHAAGSNKYLTIKKK
jgi:alkylated DNA repair dioxygenase AlkB